MYHSKGYSKVCFIIVLLAPLNGHNIEKFSEAFGEVGGGWRRPNENPCEDPGIIRQSQAKGDKKQKAIKGIYPSSLQGENTGSYRYRFHQLRSVFSP